MQPRTTRVDDPDQEKPDPAGSWPARRTLLHLVGVNGSGKSTLARRLAERCVTQGVRALLDSEQHAYDPAFDRTIVNRHDDAIQQRLVSDALTLIAGWQRSDAHLVIVDRWYESYEVDWSPYSLAAIETALAVSGFQVQVVHLVVGKDVDSDDVATMRQKVAHTRAHRPESWWTLGAGTFDERVQEECDAQIAYRRFCARSPFPTLTLCTTAMDWASYEAALIDRMKIVAERWGLVAHRTASAQRHMEAG